MSEEPRTEILRRRIELYLHCIGEGISANDTSEFAEQIAEAENELLMLTTQRNCCYDRCSTWKPINSPGRSWPIKALEQSGNCIMWLQKRTAPVFVHQQQT